MVLAPILLIFAVIAAVPIYIVWFISQVRGYPNSRRTFLRQELLRLSWISAIALVLYAVVDALFLENHFYLSLFAIPAGVWLSWYAKRKFRAAAKTQKYESRKWESRRRRKIAKQQARELEKAA